MAEADDSGVADQISRQDEPDSSLAQRTAAGVFQCAQCNSIVGDSASWMASNKQLRSLTLKSVTSKVGFSTDIETCQDGIDEGCTFRPIFCLYCKETLGKKYIASNGSLDLERKGFTFLVEKLNYYEIGSSDLTGSSDLMDFITVASPREMESHISKIRVMIIALNDRMSEVEATLMQPSFHRNVEGPGPESSNINNRGIGQKSKQNQVLPPNSMSVHNSADLENLSTAGSIGMEEDWLLDNNNQGQASESVTRRYQEDTQDFQDNVHISQTHASYDGENRTHHNRSTSVPLYNKEMSTQAHRVLGKRSGIRSREIGQQQQQQQQQQQPGNNQLEQTWHKTIPSHDPRTQKPGHIRLGNSVKGAALTIKSPRRPHCPPKESVDRECHIMDNGSQERRGSVGKIRKRPRISDTDDFN